MTMVLAGGTGDTQNQAWAADKSRFGFKMLQMMGWSEGKGLGVKEDGATAHIKMKKKDNSRGLGAEIGQNDRWDNTMGGFNGVLDKLAASEIGGTVEKDKKKKKKKSKDKDSKSKKRKRSDGAEDEVESEEKKEKRRRKEERAAKREAKAARRAKKEKLVFAKRAQNKRVSNYSAKALAEIFGQAEVVKNTAAPEEALTDERGRLKKK
jgi:Pin2-interacting protein X1